MKAALAALLTLWACAATAQEFSVTLAGAALGTLEFKRDGRTATLRSTFENTPLGVFNGTYLGTSRGSATNATFTAQSRSSRKTRDVQVTIAQGRATAVEITPPEEYTEVSDPAQVSPAVMDPVRVIGQLIDAQACPEDLTLYDGRRVVRLTLTGSQTEGSEIQCDLRYRVTDGPGHLSPLGISNARMRLRYATAQGAWQLRQIRISSGVFSVSLDSKAPGG